MVLELLECVLVVDVVLAADGDRLLDCKVLDTEKWTKFPLT